MNRPQSLSFWEKDSFFNKIDAVVIGSGIVGLNAALTLKQLRPQWRVVVAERGPLPEGASTRNAGFACFGSLTELLDDCQHMPETEVFELVKKRFLGLKRLRERVGDRALDYKPYGGYEVFSNTENEIWTACLEKMPYFNEALADTIGVKNVYQIKKGAFGFQGWQPQYIHNTAEGQIDTGKMMLALLKMARKQGIIIYNGLKIASIEPHTEGVSLITEEGWAFEAGKVIVATNGFARRLMPDLPVVPARNQVLITEPIPGLRVKGCFHYDKGYYYFRNIGQRLLLGGGRHLDFETETTDAFGLTMPIMEALIDLLNTHILPKKEVKITDAWSGILGVGPVKKPIIERVLPHTTVAVRMGGMGVAIGSLVGEEAAILALED